MEVPAVCTWNTIEVNCAGRRVKRKKKGKSCSSDSENSESPDASETSTDKEGSQNTSEVNKTRRFKLPKAEEIPLFFPISRQVQKKQETLAVTLGTVVLTLTTGGNTC